MSPPAHNPRSPAPSSTTAPTSSSCSQSRRTERIVLTNEWVDELIALGRLRIRKRAPSQARVRISSDSPVTEDVTEEQSRSSRAGRSVAGKVLPRKMTAGNPQRPPIVRRLFSEEANGEDPTVRETSNPVFRSLPRQQGGYAQFGTGYAGGYPGYQPYQGYQNQPYVQAGVSRPLTIDDVVTKTG